MVSTHDTASASPARRLVGAGVAALIAALVYAVMNHIMVNDVLAFFDERGALKSLVYLGWIFCGFVAFAAIFVTAGRLLLFVLLALFFVSLTTNYAYVLIAKVPLSLDVIEWLPHEAGQLPNAWGEYGAEIGWAVGKAAGLLALFVLLRMVVRRWAPSAWRPPYGLGVRSAAAGLFLAFHGVGVLLQPPQTVAEANLFVFGVPALFATAPELREVPVAPAGDALAEKIVVIVDESVTHEAYEKLLAARLVQFPAVDFGEAASVANCSAPSNALLRWGVEKSRVREANHDPRTNPTIWGFAKRAGFRTVLIDGQSRGNMHNYLHTREFALIDEFIPTRLELGTDQAIAEMLNERLRRPGREFIYVVKQGAHFPYEMNYPPEFAPASDSRIAKYIAAVRYTTGGFFDRLQKDLPFSNVLMLYTADHGQDFSERGLHCSAAPRAEEYSVPLVAITGAPALRALLAEPGAASMLHRASHLNIFSTALYALGYGRAWIESHYGPTLAGPPTAYITYVSLGWKATGRRDRGTVNATDFVESLAFPRRNGAPHRQLPLEGDLAASTQ